MTLLSQRCPGLSAPRVPLGAWPTPIRHVEIDGVSLIVKDEGRSGPVYGGNKVRKLEYLLADALEHDAGEVVTLGGVGSHHVVATALYARQLGLRTHAALFPQPDGEEVRAHARLIDALCEGWVPADERARIPMAWLRAWGPVRLVGRPYIVAPGGSSAVGCLGWVEAGLELAAAVEAGELAAPARVVVPLGSGGTAAGLLVGLRLAGLDAEVVAVRVTDRLIANAARVRRLARRTMAWMRSHGAELPSDLGHLRVVHGWYAGGYGVADDAVRGVMERGRAAGLALECTYSAKALGACLEEARPAPERTVFVLTANAMPLEPLLREALPEVPQRLRALLTAPEE